MKRDAARLYSDILALDAANRAAADGAGDDGGSGEQRGADAPAASNGAGDKPDADADAAAEAALPQRRPAAPDGRALAERLVTPAGAAATPRLAQPLLAEFCARLPGAGDAAAALQPLYRARALSHAEAAAALAEEAAAAGGANGAAAPPPQLYRCSVLLPSNAGLLPGAPVEGAPAGSREEARALAALAALRALHSAGRLDDALQPAWLKEGRPEELGALRL